MRVVAFAAAALLLGAAAVAADPALSPAERCLACHVDAEGRLDIVGLRALDGLPPEWSLIYEDGFDLDGDGIAGVARYVSGPDRPLAAKFGRSLAAARFEDFALIAGAAHGISITDPGAMAAVKAAFEARSPDPDLPFEDIAAQQRFEARGCAACHVTRSFEYRGRTYMPLSDFLLHDLGEGPRRTAPLWGCPACLDAPGHSGPASADDGSDE